MFFSRTGNIRNNFYLSGLTGFPIYLLDAPVPMLFEGGISCAGKIYVEGIKAILCEKQPEFLFLSHVHWDHCGAVSTLKHQFPSLKIAGASQGGDILKRPNAQFLINQLNYDIRKLMESHPEIDASQLRREPFQTFELDVELSDGQFFDAGEGLKVQALATAGHTRDHFSYYIPRDKILIAGEAAGLVLTSGKVSCEFVYDYEAYFASLSRLASLPIEVLCQGHRVVIIGQEDIRSFFQQSISETFSLKEKIYELLDREHGDVNRVIRQIKLEQYDPIPAPKQPETPYLLNLTAQVKHLAGKMKPL